MDVTLSARLGTFKHVQADANFEVFVLIQAAHWVHRAMEFG